MSIIILSCVLFVLWYLWSWLKPRSPTSPPTYPGALPIIGHVHKLARSAQDIWRQEKIMYNYCLQNENITEVRLGPHSLYILTDPDDCLTVANVCLEKPYLYNFGRAMYNRGLITATAAEWKPHRRLLNPAFSQQVLQPYVGEFIIQAKTLVAQLSSEVGRGPFDVHSYLMSTIMATASRTTLGIKADENRETLKNYGQAVEDIFQLYFDRIQRVWLHFPFIFNWSSYKKKEDHLIKIMTDVTKRVITNRKSELRLSDGSTKNIDTESEQLKPLIDQLLDLAEKQGAFSDNEIMNHLDAIIVGAFDTTATTITFTLLLIGSQQDVQERIYKELQEVLGNQERDLNRHDLPKLVYMEAVIKEALRLYPPVPRVARCSSTDVQLKKYVLPAANSTYLISVYGINRHPMWGADADQFRPERWLDRASLPESRGAFASFSVGRRNCIGKL